MCLFLIIFVSPIGPSSWYKNYPVAEGNRQSPIDIVPNEASHDRDLGPIMTNYDHCTSINISNNGHSVVVEFNDSDDRSGEKIVLLFCLFVCFKFTSMIFSFHFTCCSYIICVIYVLYVLQTCPHLF